MCSAPAQLRICNIPCCCAAAAALGDLLEVPLLGVPAAGWPAASPAEAGDGDAENGGFVASSTGGQISSRLLSMRSAAALLELPQVHQTAAPPLAEGFADENAHAGLWQPAHQQGQPAYQRQHPAQQGSWRNGSSSSSPICHSPMQFPGVQQPSSAGVLPSQLPWLQPEQHFDALWQWSPLDLDSVSITSSSIGDDADSIAASSSDLTFVERLRSAVLLLGRGLAYLL